MFLSETDRVSNKRRPVFEILRERLAGSLAAKVEVKRKQEAV
jgi:hypothetical protein